MFRGGGVSALADLQGLARGDWLAAPSPVQGVALRAVRDHRAVLGVDFQTISATGALAGETASCPTEIGHTLTRTA